MSSMSELFYNIRYECKKKENESYYSGRNEKICGWIWDGIMCWPSTNAGVELTLPCPEYFGYNSKVIRIFLEEYYKIDNFVDECDEEVYGKRYLVRA